jgi:tetratricopeptide (TPR) repeat protein
MYRFFQARLFRARLYSMVGLTVLLAGASVLTAQRKGNGGGGSGNMPTAGASDFIVHGTVVLPDAVIPGRLVAVERTCAGRSGQVVFADSKGRFSFDLGVIDHGGTLNQNSGTFNNASDLRNCTIHASISGFRTQVVELESFIKSEKGNLGELMLQPIGKQTAAVLSVTDGDVPKNARKDYDAGLDAAAKSKWPEAVAAMEKAANAYPKYASAWLSLGILEAARTNTPAALRAYAKAMEADPKFAPPYLESAVLQSAAGDWSKAIEASGIAIGLDPDAFPRAYYVNAVSHVRMNDADDAEKRAEAGIRVDTAHEIPDLEYIEGILLLSKNDVKGARKQFESYLEHAPNGVNSANARQQLAETSAVK